MFKRLLVGAMLLGTMARQLFGADVRLKRISSFACYYGSGHVADLAKFDLVILESNNYTPEDIQAIKAKGATVVGYLSLGETREVPPKLPKPHPGDPARLPMAYPPYFLDKEGKGTADRNGGWGSHYVDARAPAWHARVLDVLVPHLLKDKGVDGLFLDTLDTVDYYPATSGAMVQLVAEIRTRFPRIPIVANRGFSMLEGLVPVVDAFLFEDFTTRWDPEKGRASLHPAGDLPWVDGVLEKIRKLGAERGVQVFVLDYADKQDPKVMQSAVDRAHKAGLTYSITTGNLDKMPVAGGAGR